MRNPDGSFSTKYPSVINELTGNRVVMAAPKGRIDQSVEIFDHATHDGHLVCADCLIARMKVIDEYKQGGSRIPVKAHFKIAHDSAHHPDCASVVRAEDHDPTSRDLTRGRVIFLNGVPRTLDRSSDYNEKAAGLLERIEGKLKFTDDDLETRERLQAKTPKDVFRIMKLRQMTQEILDDSWVVFKNTKTPWSDFYLRRGGREEGMFARFERFARQILERGNKSLHPVMLQFNVNQIPEVKADKAGKDRLRIALPTFNIKHPETGRVLTVHYLVHVRDAELFAEFTTPGDDGKVGEFTLITVPYTNFDKPPRGKPTGRYFKGTEKQFEPSHLYINCELTPQWYARQTLQDLNRDVIRARERALEIKAPA